MQHPRGKEGPKGGNSLITTYLSYCDSHQPSCYTLEGERNLVPNKYERIQTLTWQRLIEGGSQSRATPEIARQPGVSDPPRPTTTKPAQSAPELLTDMNPMRSASTRREMKGTLKKSSGTARQSKCTTCGAEHRPNIEGMQTVLARNAKIMKNLANNLPGGDKEMRELQAKHAKAMEDLADTLSSDDEVEATHRALTKLHTKIAKDLTGRQIGMGLPGPPGLGPPGLLEDSDDLSSEDEEITTHNKRDKQL